MAFVDGDSLLVRVRLAFGASIFADPATWVWTDVTQYWHTPDPVDIGWGRTPGADQAETSTMTLTLKNTDSRFTAYDPRSPYWPHVKKWTPIEYDIDLGDGVGWRNRYSGFVRKWPLTWPGSSPFMALAKIECVGILGRLGRGKPDDKSPLRRAITSPQHSGLLAYWPLEDQADSTQAASAIPGHPPLTAVGNVQFATLDPSTSRGETNRYGTKPLPDLSLGGGLFGGVVPPGSSSPIAWTVQFMADSDGTEGAAAGMAYWTWTAGGAVWEIGYMGPSSYDTALLVDGVERIRDNSSFQSPYEWRLEVWQNGANINARLTIVGETVGDITPGGAPPWTASWPGTLGWPTDFAANKSLFVTTPAVHLIGHLQVWDGVNAPEFYPRITNIYGDSRDSAWTAWRAESAHERLIRLCAEDRVNLVCPAVSEDAATWMGPQPDGAPLTLYQQSETVDQGVLYESGFGLGYLPRDARYNAPVALTIDASLGQLSMPFEPVDDDQLLRNRWTVRRPGGSSVTVEDQDSIDSQGEFEASVDVNVVADSYLAEQASWRLHLTTVPEPRYPQVGIDLGQHPELAAAWSDCVAGSRINVINPPEQNVPGTVDQLIVGGRETFKGRRSWKAQISTVPASPWQVAAVGGEQRVAADGSVLAAELAEDATAFLLSSTTANGPWTEDPANFPLDMRVGGQRVTASAIARSFVDTFGRTVAGGWGAPWTMSLGDPADVSVNGSVGLIALDTVGDERHMTTDLGAQTQDMRLWVRAPAVPTGAPINEGILLRYVDVNNYIWVDAQINTDSTITLRLVKRVAGVATVLASVPSGVTHSTVVDLALRAEVDGSLLRARAWLTSSTDPGIWQATAVDGALPTGTRGGAIARRMTGNTNGTVAVQFDNVSVQQPQLVTLSARGVARAWPAGTDVDVWAPAIVSL